LNHVSSSFTLSSDDSDAPVTVNLSVNHGNADAVVSETLGDEQTPLLGAANRTVQVDKDIGFFESLVYMFVQNYGFAILSVPIVFQQG
jgi:hypothetical protein